MLKNGLVHIIIKCIANFVLRVAYGSTVQYVLYYTAIAISARNYCFLFDNGMKSFINTW